MDTNLNLKGRVQIYNNNTGECVLDKHNAITDLGKMCILGRMTQLTENSTKLFTKASISVMYFSYGSTNINNAVEIGALADPDATVAKGNFYGKFFGNTSWQAVPGGSTSGLLAGSVKPCVTATGGGTTYEFDYSSAVHIKFIDTGSSVSVTITDSNDNESPNPAVSAGCFSYNGNNSIVYYAYIKVGGTPTPSLTGISLGTPINDYHTGSGKSGNVDDFTYINDKYCIIPFTGIQFDLGALAASSTYVIKYTLYM